MANPLDLMIKDPTAMRYELMRAQAEGMKAGGAVRGYAGGGKTYGSEVPDANPPVQQMREALAERSLLDTLGGAGETGLNFLTGMFAQPAAGVAGAVGETMGLGKGEDIAGRVQRGLTYEPTTAAGQQMQQDLMDLMVKSGVASLPPVVSGINPAALRVNPGAGRYIAGQAVEAARPLHEAYMAGEVPGTVNPAASVVKNGGGNWLPPESTGSVEKFLSPLKGLTDQALADELGLPAGTTTPHISNWVDKRLNPYIKNQMGTPKDPVRLMAEDKVLENGQVIPGVLHVPSESLGLPSASMGSKRVKQGFPSEGFGKSQRAKDWEDASDYVIKTETAEGTVYAPEWAKTLKPDALVNRIGSYDYPSSLGFDHLVDELRNATGGDTTLPQQLRINPAKLERMTVPEAVERVAKINEWRFEQAGKIAVENVAKLPEAMPSTNPKFTWRNLNNPEDAALSEGAHKAVGKDMGICIGGSDYIGRAAKGEADHFTLFDDKGHPHVAIETRPGKKTYPYGSSTSAAEQEAVFKDALSNLGITEMNAKTEPAINTEMSRIIEERFPPTYGPPNIIQVKGKANEIKVNPKYQEQLKEFLNSRPFGNVQETGGLIDTSKEILLGNKILGLRIPLTAKEVQAKLPRFVTEQDLIDLATSGYDRYARGGAVKPRAIVSPVDFAYNLDEMRHALVRQR